MRLDAVKLTTSTSPTLLVLDSLKDEEQIGAESPSTLPMDWLRSGLERDVQVLRAIRPRPLMMLSSSSRNDTMQALG